MLHCVVLRLLSLAVLGIGGRHGGAAAGVQRCRGCFDVCEIRELALIPWAAQFFEARAVVDADHSVPSESSSGFTCRDI